MTSPSTFGDWFTARSDAWVAAATDRSQAALARAIGCDPAFITNWRAGKSEPAAKTRLGSVARLLATDAEDARLLYRLCGIDVEPLLDHDDGVTGSAEA